VVKEELVKQALGGGSKELVEQTLRVRVAFITDEAWDKIGLPRGDVKNDKSTKI
jgi:hypothetical protein